jgi:hypothetical protein
VCHSAAQCGIATALNAHGESRVALVFLCNSFVALLLGTIVQVLPHPFPRGEHWDTGPALLRLTRLTPRNDATELCSC